MSKIGPAIQTR